MLGIPVLFKTNFFPVPRRRSTSSLPLSVLRTQGARKPLYQMLAHTLEERIQSKVIAPGNPLPSERELCLEFNLSRQTVRNAIEVLSEKGLLNSRAGSGHFVRESSAASPLPKSARRNTRQIGVICAPRVYLEEPSQWGTLIGIKGVLSQYGYSVALSVSHKDKKAGFFPCYQHWLDDGDIEGYIGVSIPPALQRRLFESGYPSLSLGYVWEGIALPSIALDFRTIYRDILSHVHGQGHESICCTLFHGDTAFTRNVLAGIEAGIQESGLKRSRVKVCRCSDTAYDLVGCVRTALRVSGRPTSLILQGDEHLSAVMRFLEMEGIRVPEDLHLTVVQVTNSGFPFTDRISYFDFDYPRFGHVAARRLLDLIEGKSPNPLHEDVVFGKIADPSLAVSDRPGELAVA